MRLRTARLELIAAGEDVVEAELQDHRRLSDLLNATVPDGWPPPLLDERVLRLFLQYIREDASQAGWRAWYFVLESNGERTVVGNGGFKGPPDADGMIELGYSMMPAYQGLGICTEAVGTLIAWAFSHRDVRSVRAETTPDNLASMRVMEKNGLSLVGPGTDTGDVRYAVTREDFDSTAPAERRFR